MLSNRFRNCLISKFAIRKRCWKYEGKYYKNFNFFLILIFIGKARGDLEPYQQNIEVDLVEVYENIYDEGLISNNSNPNCTTPSIQEFPSDIFSQEERQQGFAILHLVVSLYVFYAFAIVCSDYFVPSVQLLSSELRMESDIAGATLMGMATSSPELFTNIVGTFIMKGDIGVGTIIGSAVFNHLAICACLGFGTSKVVNLDWWPVTRDVIFYTISVLSLFVILYDERIYWYEAGTLLLIYALYLLGMYNDVIIQAWVERAIGMDNNYNSPQLRTHREFSLNTDEAGMSSSRVAIVTIIAASLDDKKMEGIVSAYELPRGRRSYIWLDWACSWPIRALFSLTIPDCRKDHLHKSYPLTFVMSTLWIACLSYLASWMMTLVGYTLLIPDTVFGVSVIAAGTSVPEAVSSVIVARKGLGTMALGNGVGSNTFNILVCLGLPWLIRAFLNRNLSTNYAQIGSIALEYSIGVLVLSIVLMYVILVCNKFCIDKKVAGMALGLYVCFLTFHCLLELNVIANVNLPICNL